MTVQCMMVMTVTVMTVTGHLIIIPSALIGGQGIIPMVEAVGRPSHLIRFGSLEPPLRDEGQVGLDVGGDGPDVLV
jgi:hypothetical protein